MEKISREILLHTVPLAYSNPSSSQSAFLHAFTVLNADQSGL